MIKNDHGKKIAAAGTQPRTSKRAHRKPADDPGSRGAEGSWDPGPKTIERRAMTRSPGKHLQMPSTPWGKKTPGDSESESGRGGVARAPSTQERSGAGSTRGRSVQGREPSDESRRRALSPDEEGQEEPHGAVRLHQPMGARGKAGSVRTKPQGTGPNVNQRGENTQRSLDETDTSFNPGAHAPIRPLFDTDAEQLSLALHQLQCKVQLVAVLHHNTREAQGSCTTPDPPQAKNKMPYGT